METDNNKQKNEINQTGCEYRVHSDDFGGFEFVQQKPGLAFGFRSREGLSVANQRVR